MTRSWLPMLVLFAACEKPITATVVNGTVNGVSFPEATALAVTDTDLLAGARRTVWMAPGLRCSDLTPSDLFNVYPSAIGTSDGGFAPLLVVSTSTMAFLDTGDGGERLIGSTERWHLQSADDGVLRGRFTASFGDGGTFTGDFVAPPCSTANAGCSAAPVSLPAIALLLLIRRRRSR